MQTLLNIVFFEMVSSCTNKTNPVTLSFSQDLTYEYEYWLASSSNFLFHLCTEYLASVLKKFWIYGRGEKSSVKKIRPVGVCRSNRVLFLGRNFCQKSAMSAGALLCWRNRPSFRRSSGRFFRTTSRRRRKTDKWNYWFNLWPLEKIS
jgi:hypothetical protein